MTQVRQEMEKRAHPQGADHYTLRRLKQLESAQRRSKLYLAATALLLAVVLGWQMWSLKALVRELLKRQTERTVKTKVELTQLRGELNTWVTRMDERLDALNSDALLELKAELNAARHAIQKTLAAGEGRSRQEVSLLAEEVAALQRQLTLLQDRLETAETAAADTRATVAELARAAKALSARARYGEKRIATAEPAAEAAAQEDSPKPTAPGSLPAGGGAGVRPEAPDTGADGGAVAATAETAAEAVKIFPVVLHGSNLIITFKRGSNRDDRVEINDNGYIGTIYIPRGHIAEVSGTANGSVFKVSSKLQGKIRNRMTGQANIWQQEPKENLFKKLW
jgi:hypothetical protein